MRVTPAAELAVRHGHPWVYGDKVRQQNRRGETGEITVIYDRQDRFLGLGLYDKESAIRLRMLHVGRPVKVDAVWWRRKLEETVAKRDGIFSPDTTGHRLINGENDGWPALILDRYADTLVLKIYAALWLPHLADIESLLRTVLAPRAIVLRLSRNLISLASRDYGVEEGFLGEPGDDVVIFQENGLYFTSEVRFGQKTGFFLDQRENRERVEHLSAGRAVLNAFSFSGGFSLYAARGGAHRVTDVDISAHALASAQENFQLNAGDPRVAAAEHESIQADAFDWMAEAVQSGRSGPRFGLIVTDPPSLAKRETERAGATLAYERLAVSAFSLLDSGGTVVSASCSAHVSARDFQQAVRRAATSVFGQSWEELWTAGHAADHPISFREGEYLKAIAIRGG
ncbi:MAG: class I SAM-dependent rRNA methyltransferase [Verrucomicrobiaceae bacterium]|nr:MAG: class I SAM-dependent rRNA methyltransferase [Verrucomicrobiaceae bacterium]